MNTHKLFLEFDATIRLNKSKKSKLRSNRDTLRNKIRKYFKDKGWDIPKFYSQGSFPLNTNLNPIKAITDNGDVKEKYDLDDGVYFICPESERKEPATYHNRLRKAVNKHAESVIDKATCVRVIYADGHHIDLPSYWLEKDGDIPQLTHKSEGYIKSDPKEFMTWVSKKISDNDKGDQLRRIIRYFKAWKNYREDKNKSIKLPSGFILTILACNNFVMDSRDDVSFKSTVESIKNTLDDNFCCYRPTTPKNEELLAKYSKDMVLGELNKLIKSAQKAIDSDDEKKASEYWREVFGERFPLGKDNETHNQSEESQQDRIKVSAPWLSH